MKRLILIAAFAAALPMAAHAADDVYPSLDAIPAAMIETLLQPDQFEQKYVATMAGVLRANARETGALTLADIEAAEARQKRELSRSRLRDAMAYDQNFDLKVTEDEIRTSFNDRRARRGDDTPAAERKKMLEQQVAGILARYDTDKDGVITSREAGTPPENDERWPYRRSGNSRDLLALDPDKDGTLTGVEMEALARKAFRTVDKNRDGTISREETQGLAKVIRVNRLKSSGCALPAAGPQEKVMMIYTAGGGAWSDIALGGEARETNAVTLDIGTGAEPLYLVVASQKPVIWRVTGDTARISRMVLAGPVSAQQMELDPDGGRVILSPSKGKEVLAGVTGLPTEKVLFLKGDNHQNCLPIGLQMHFGSGQVRHVSSIEGEESSLKMLLGRDADQQYAGYNPVKLAVGSDKISALPPAENTAPAPEGFDPEVWKQALVLQPGGVAFSKGESIVTEARPQVYKILPGWVGLAQMVKQGILKAEKMAPPATRIIVTDGMSMMVVRNSGGGAVVKNSDARIIVTDDWEFRILKDADAFPVGLDGAFSTQFVLPKGIKLPDMKRRGASCIRLEEGAEAPKNTPLCN